VRQPNERRSNEVIRARTRSPGRQWRTKAPAVRTWATQRPGCRCADLELEQGEGSVAATVAHYGSGLALAPLLGPQASGWRRVMASTYSVIMSTTTSFVRRIWWPGR